MFTLCSYTELKFNVEIIALSEVPFLKQKAVKK